jgi:quinolinate synthase
MFRIDQEHIAWVLDNLAAGKVVNRITVHAEARKWALIAIDRMLNLAAPMGSAAPAVKTAAGKNDAARTKKTASAAAAAATTAALTD